MSHSIHAQYIVASGARIEAIIAPERRKAQRNALTPREGTLGWTETHVATTRVVKQGQRISRMLRVSGQSQSPVSGFGKLPDSRLIKETRAVMGEKGGIRVAEGVG